VFFNDFILLLISIFPMVCLLVSDYSSTYLWKFTNNLEIKYYQNLMCSLRSFILLISQSITLIPVVILVQTVNMAWILPAKNIFHIYIPIGFILAGKYTRLFENRSSCLWAFLQNPFYIWFWFYGDIIDALLISLLSQ
jgi:hypothetical protein